MIRSIRCYFKLFGLFLFFFFCNTLVNASQVYSGLFDYIAYSYVDDINDAPVNTAAHFELCASNAFAFNSIKGDLRVTSDNKIVMCHDKGFTLNKDGRIISFDSSNMIDIHSLTYAQCIALQYADKYRDSYVNVCDFETYLSICSRNDKNAFITIRDQYITELLNNMMPIIYKYGMQNKCIINSFTLNSLKLVRKYDSSIKTSWVINNGKLTTSIVDTALELGNCILTLYNFPASRYGGFNSLSSYETIISYAQSKNIPLYAAIVNDITVLDRLRSYGISGAQIRIKCNHVKHYWDDGIVMNNPTYSSAGTKVFTCTICGESKSEIIPALPKTSISLCTISGIKNKTYSGKRITQNLTIKYNGKVLEEGIDFSISYQDNIDSGLATLMVVGKGKYKDTIYNQFIIYPQRTKLKNAQVSKRNVTLKWKKVSSGSGYELQYKRKNSKKYKSLFIKSIKKTKTTIKKLKKGVYVFRIRVYKKKGWQSFQSKWSKKIMVRVK